MLNAAALPPHKQDLMKFIENKKYELENLSVDIRYGTKVDGEFISELKPYFVVEAFGGKAFVPNIKGIDKDNVYMALDVLKGGADMIAKLKKGSTVIIGGGTSE